MPEEEKKDDLIDVGDADEKATEINLDEKGEPEKTEAPKEEKIEVEEVAQPEEKKEGGEVEVKEETKEDKKDEKKEELEKYSEGVQKRIAKLTRKMREAERQREAALIYAKSVQGEQRSLKDRLSKLDTGYVKEMEDRITSSVTAAESKLKNARDAGDISAEVIAQKEIAKLGYEEARLAEMKINQAAKKPKEEKSELNQQTNIQQEQTRRPVPDARATEWAGKNKWFGSDNAMTYTAFDMHRKLVEEEGYDPQSEDYYGELDRRIKLEFPHKFGNVTEQTTKPTQTVASATRNVKRGTGRTTVKLTSSQVAIAKKLNVPLEEYAKQLNVIEE